jgi:DNA replication and repair protein RecF
MTDYGYLDSLSVVNYRNILSGNLQFSKGINIIYGQNAQGKTNILEAVWLLSGGKSFRGTKDSDMINFNSDSFRIQGNILSKYGENSIVITCSKTNPSFKNRMASVNGGPFQPAGQIAGNFYCVVFSPSHLEIVSGGPSARRKFIDAALCQIYPAFIDSYRKYNRTLAVRNSFLKNIKKYDKNQKKAMFDTCDNFLAVYGGEIDRYRRRFCRRMSERAKNYYEQISQSRENIDLKYVKFARDKNEFLEKLDNSRPRDIATGITNTGPHRGDLAINIDGKPAKSYSSQGQQRSGVIAMKLAESDIIESVTGQKPAMLLDDVLSELDYSRQEYLINNISQRQIFITGCDIDRINRSNSKKFYVENGCVKAENRCM